MKNTKFILFFIVAILSFGVLPQSFAQDPPADRPVEDPDQFLNTGGRDAGAKDPIKAFDPPAAAPDRTVVGGLESAGTTNQKQIDVDETDKDLREVMEDIGRKVGRNILVAPGVEETVTITLRDIPWTDAVRLIAKLTKCDIERPAPKVLLLTQPPKVTIEFADANVRTVLSLLAAYSGKNIIIAPEVVGKITLSLKDVHWLKALKSIVKTVGPYVVVQDGPDLLRVVPQESIERQLETTIIRLKYVRPPPRYQAVPPKPTGGGGGGGGGAAGGGSSVGEIFSGTAPTNNTDEPETSFTLFKALRGIIDATTITDDSIQYAAGSNSLIIRATKPTTDEIHSIINQIDVEPEQIFIQIRFISTTDRNFLETGLKFSGGDLQNGLQLSGPFPTGQQVQSARFSDPFIQAAQGGQQQQQQQGGGAQATGIPQPVGTLPFILGEGQELFTKGFRLPAILDFTGLNATLNWIDSVESTRVLQEPSLFTLDNQSAVIFVGENIPFATTDNNNDVNGNVSQSIQVGEGSPISVGFSLFVEPHVVPDTNKIILTIIPRVNSLTGTTSPITGFERFSFSANSFIDLPRTSEQAIVTRILIEDGQTAVIGGLLTEVETIREIGIPVLSDIPLIGALFINKVNQKETRNLVIFVTPTIVRDQAQNRSLYNDVRERQQSFDGIYRRKTRLKKKNAKESTKEKE
jgi:type II secretory pathway component GspD/PulD (secretin)